MAIKIIIDKDLNRYIAYSYFYMGINIVLQGLYFIEHNPEFNHTFNPIGYMIILNLITVILPVLSFIRFEKVEE